MDYVSSKRRSQPIALVQPQTPKIDVVVVFIIDRVLASRVGGVAVFLQFPRRDVGSHWLLSKRARATTDVFHRPTSRVTGIGVENIAPEL